MARDLNVAKVFVLFALWTAGVTLVGGRSPLPRLHDDQAVPETLQSLFQAAGVRNGPLSFDPAPIIQSLAPKMEGKERFPVLFIPPLTGVQLDVTAKEQGDVPFFLCKHDFGTVRGWFNPWMLFPGWCSCWVERFSLTCDLPEGTPCHSPYGVTVAPHPGFASAMTVDSWGFLSVYKDLAAALGGLGYQEGVDLAAHLYDFRLSPLDYMAKGASFERLKREIEELVEATGKPVIAIGLSMGPTYFSLFLDKYVKQSWKEKHVKALISVSGFWGGTPVAPLAVISGVWGGAEKFIGKSFLRLARGLPVLSWLLPSSTAFGKKPLFVNTQLNRSYTAADMGDALAAAGAKQAAGIWAQVQPDIHINPPNVSVFCFYGTQLKTPLSVEYNSPDFSDPPTVRYSDGDGVIPTESLRVCRDWMDMQDSPVVVREFPNFQHGDLLHEREGFKAVMDAVAAIHN